MAANSRLVTVVLEVAGLDRSMELYWDAFAVAQAHDAGFGLAAPVDAS